MRNKDSRARLRTRKNFNRPQLLLYFIRNKMSIFESENEKIGDPSEEL